MGGKALNPTPHRTIRVPDEIWTPAIAKAAENETTLSAVINEFLRQYAS